MTRPISPSYLECRQELVSGLIETVSAALLVRSPQLDADPYDIELVLDALRVLRPALTELDLFSGMLHLVRGQVPDATRVLSQLVAHAPQFSYAKALLAVALACQDDPSWRRVAAEALEQNAEDEATQRLVQVLVARDELREAVRAHAQGAPFAEPASVTALGLSEPTPSDAPAEAATGEEGGGLEEPASHRYLRI